MPLSAAVDWLCADRGLDPHGKESLCLATDPNIIIDAGLNDDSLSVAKAILDDKRFILHPLTTAMEVLVVYGSDGARMLRLPLVQRPPKGGYRQPHWLPTLVRLGRAAL
jgi:hypothetical protein